MILPVAVILEYNGCPAPPFGFQTIQKLPTVFLHVPLSLSARDPRIVIIPIERKVRSGSFASWRDHGGSSCCSAMAMDGKLGRSFLSDRLELRLLLVAQRSIEGLERVAHQIERLLHGAEPTVYRVKANG